MDKSFVILSSNRRQCVNLELKAYHNNKEGNVLALGKFMDVYVDRILKFDLDISEICKKLSKSVDELYITSSCVPN